MIARRARWRGYLEFFKEPGFFHSQVVCQQLPLLFRRLTIAMMILLKMLSSMPTARARKFWRTELLKSCNFRFGYIAYLKLPLAGIHVGPAFETNGNPLENSR